MKKLCLVFAALLLTGCNTFAASRYSISADNVVAAKSALSGQKLAVGEFSAAEPGNSSLMCRAAGPIELPDGASFEGYIRKAFIDELKIAEVYDESAEVKLTAVVDRVEMDSFAGAWTLSLHVFPDTADEFTVESTHAFPSSIFAIDACMQTANSFQAAVQDLVKKVFDHPKFNEVVAGAVPEPLAAE